MRSVLLASALLHLATPTAPAAAQPTVRLLPPQQLAAAAHTEPTGATGGVDDSGRALLAWSEGDDARSQILVATAAHGEPFGPPRVLRAGSRPKAAVAPDGRAVIAYAGPDGAELVAGHSGGAFGEPARLAEAQPPGAAVIAGDGTAAVVWGDVDDDATVQLVAPGGVPGATRRFKQYLRGGRLLISYNEGVGLGEDELVAGRDGTIALLTARGLLERRPGQRAFTKEHRVFRTRYAEPRVAVGADGRVGVIAIGRPKCIFEYGCVGEVHLAQRAPRASRFAAPVRAPVRRHGRTEGRPIPSAFAPDLAYAQSGAPVVSWIEDEFVCTVCDMEIREGKRILWAPGRRRVVLQGPSLLERVGRSVATFGGRRELWSAGPGRPRRLATLGVSVGPWSTLIGGRTRMLLVAGSRMVSGGRAPVRIQLGNVSR